MTASFTYTVRAGRAGAGERTTQLELAAEVSRSNGHLAARLVSPGTTADDLAASARAGVAELEALLPPAGGGCVAVECGVVETASRTATGRRSPGQRVSYRVATSGDTVLRLDTGPAGRFSPPWSGAVDVAAVPPTAPLVLGPSALQALVVAVLSTAGAEALPKTRALRVDRTLTSPYPPHDVSLFENGLGAAPTALSTLLGRAASRPPGALGGLSGGGLQIELDRVEKRPESALVLDALQAVPRPDGATFVWSADCSLRLPGDGLRRVARPIRFEVDARDLLGAARAAVGPLAPALTTDAVEGASYGLAPPLVLACDADRIL